MTGKGVTADVGELSARQFDWRLFNGFSEGGAVVVVGFQFVDQGVSESGFAPGHVVAWIVGANVLQVV